MNPPQRDYEPGLFQAFLKSAQYIVRLQSQQDVWDHLAKLIVTHFPADWTAFARRDAPNAGAPGEISLHHGTLPEEIIAPQILTEDVRTLIAEVLESGFLALRVPLGSHPFDDGVSSYRGRVPGERGHADRPQGS